MTRKGRFSVPIAAIIALLAAALCAVGPVLAQSPTTTATTNPAAPTGTSTRVVQVTSLTGPIHAGATRLVGRAIESAERRGAEAVVLVLDTWGGYERATQDVVLRLQQAAVPVVIYVGPSGAQARAAGLFIGQAGDLLIMAPGTSIGGAPLGDAPPPGTAAGLDGAAVYARNLAQQRGRNASWTEQAVRDGDSLPATEALRIRVVDEVASDLQDLLLKLDGRTVNGPWGTRQLATRGASLETVEATPVETLLSYLIDPNVAYLLLVIGLYGIMVEMAAPGVSFPGVVGVLSVLLALYAFSQLPVNWMAVIVLAVAAAFLLAETQLPSHGLLAVVGTGAFLAGSLLLFRSPGPAPFGATATLNPWLVFSLTATSAVLFGWLLRIGLVALHWPQLNAAPEAGELAVAGSVVEATGTVHLHGQTWTAEWAPGSVRPGQRVRVVGRRGLTLLVEPAEPVETLESRSEEAGT